MPLTHFICTDAKQVKIEDCLKECRCPDRDGLRCMDKAVLLFIANGRRSWTGKPSTTQITEGLMQKYLQEIYPYAESPRECLFRLYGSMLHLGLEIADDELMQEIPLENEYLTGRLDTYNSTEQAISDHKYVSSFQVEDFLTGNKTAYILQLNIYKVLFEEMYPDKPVKKLVSNIYVRDWNKRIAAQKKIKRAYRIAQRIMPREDVLSIIKERAAMLSNCISSRTPPPVCPPEERCFSPDKPDAKCKEYCAVNTWCPYFMEKYGTDTHKFI